MKIALTVSSLSALQKALRKSAKQIRTAPAKIVETLLDVGELEAEDNILTGYAADGNTDISVVKEQKQEHGTLSMIGGDVAYQEFGYGLVGHVGRNPRQPPEYQQGQRTEWVYIENGNKRWSHGMEAQMPMYRASKSIREVLPQVCKDIVEDAVEGLR